MKKLLTLGLVFIAAALLHAEGAKEGPRKEQAKAETAVEAKVFKWASSFAVSHPLAIGQMECAENIAKRTNGAIKLEVHLANTLGSEAEITNMVRMGSILGAQIGAQMFQSYVPGLGGWQLPFVFKNPEQLSRFLWEYALDNVWNKEVRQATGIKALTLTPQGMRQLTTKGIPVRNPADLRGIKIRSMEQPVAIANIRSLGGNPIPIAWSELYSALLTGTAVGQENPIENIISAKFYEVQDHIMLTNHSIAYSVYGVNEKVWDTIPAQYQAIITEEFSAMARKGYADIMAAESGWLQDLQKRGMKVIKNEELDIAAFKDSAEKVVEEVFRTHKDYEALMKYRKIAVDWLAQNIK